MLNENSYANDFHVEGTPPSHENQGVREMLSQPGIIFIIFGSVFVLFAGAIRLTRVSVASTIDSFETYVVSDNKLKTETLCNWIRGRNGIFGNFKSFWAKLPRRVWNFYIESFLIPSYRKEWGKYKQWSYRARPRQEKSLYLRQLIRAQKKLKSLAAKKDRCHTAIPHNHGWCQRIRINICGMRYETQLRTLERFPDTLLGNPRKRIQYYDTQKQEYYFDRNRDAFESILYFYQSGGRFRRPDNVQADVLLEDAQFYELSQVVIDQFRIEEGLSPPDSKHEILPQNLLRRKIWLLFDYPESSHQAAYVAILSCGALFLSIGVFCIETIDDMEFQPHFGIIDKKTGRIGITKLNIVDIRDPLFFTETVCNIWFIVEFVTRFLTCPFYFKFLKSPLNLIDLIAVAPFLISALSPGGSKMFGDDGDTDINETDMTSTATDSLYLLRIVRVVRVFRIFKLSKHSKGLKILGKTLKASLNELILLIFFIMLGVLLFSSTMYFAELDHPHTQFESIPGGFWWAVITITTVGFGDVVPQTVLGRIVGSLCAVAGVNEPVLTIALPVPVIVSNFNFFYHQAIDEADLRWININHVADCPYRPAGNSIQKKPGKLSKKSKKNQYSSDEEFGSLKQQGF